MVGGTEDGQRDEEEEEEEWMRLSEDGCGIWQMMPQQRGSHKGRRRRTELGETGVLISGEFLIYKLEAFL